jgi:hypothetical protein
VVGPLYGSFILKDPANNYKIWIAYAVGKNKGGSGKIIPFGGANLGGPLDRKF